MGNSSSSASGGGAKQQQINDDDSSCSSYVSNGSSSRGGGRMQKKKLNAHPSDMENIDEESGYSDYEMSSLLVDGGHDGGGGGGSSNKQPISKHRHHNRDNWRGSHDRNDDSQSAPSDADDTKTNSERDVRSRALFLKTAFWITCWYGTSLATLFLNKIILSREGSSVHVLGMCQMTTAAVLGGWSTYGGVEYVRNLGVGLSRYLPESIRRGMGLGTTAAGISRNASRGSGGSKGGEQHSESLERQNSEGLPSTPSKTERGGFSFNFVRDMSIVGVLRGLTVVLGLIALEHVPVSFVETIKATAPAFTVIFAKLILKERTAGPVMLTLIPVVAGLILCSASELRFDTIGFVAAVMNNCADCVQNVMSKRMLTHLKPTQLQFYTSVAALALQAPFVLRDATGLIRKWAHPMDMEDILEITVPEDEDGSMHEGMSLTKLLIIDAILYHLQSVSAYCTMGCMSPVSQSVANTLKRSLLVWASILYFGNPVTNSGIVGIIMVVSGVFLYNHIRRIYQS